MLCTSKYVNIYRPFLVHAMEGMSPFTMLDLNEYDLVLLNDKQDLLKTASLRSSIVKGDIPSMACTRNGRSMFTYLLVHNRFIIILRVWDVMGTSASSKKVFSIMYFCTIIILYGSVFPLAEYSCNRAGRSNSSPVLDLPHICRKVRSSLLKSASNNIVCLVF